MVVGGSGASKVGNGSRPVAKAYATSTHILDTANTFKHFNLQISSIWSLGFVRENLSDWTPPAPPSEYNMLYFLCVRLNADRGSEDHCLYLPRCFPAAIYLAFKRLTLS